MITDAQILIAFGTGPGQDRVDQERLKYMRPMAEKLAEFATQNALIALHERVAVLEALVLQLREAIK